MSFAGLLLFLLQTGLERESPVAVSHQTLARFSRTKTDIFCRKSPSPRRTRSSRHRRSSRRADVRDHDQGDGPPELVPLTFLGYQHLPDGTLHPVYAAPQPATYDPNQHTTGEQYQNDAGINDDELVDSQHFCFKCGKARSKQYHMDNPIKPGSKAPASCCSRCRKKNTDTELSSKYLQHFCTDCGRVRSRSYHREHPVRAGHKPRPNYCLSCRAHREEDTRVDDGWEDLDAGVSALQGPAPAPLGQNDH